MEIPKGGTTSNSLDEPSKGQHPVKPPRFPMLPQSDTNKIHYVSGSCGSRKTLGLCNFIHTYHRDENFLIVVPTLVLADQIQDTLHGLKLKPQQLTSQTHPNAVVAEVTARLKYPRPDGDIVIITWITYERIRFFANRKSWHIFIDEIPQFDRFYELRLPRNSHLLTDHLRPIPLVDTRLGVLALKNSKLTKRMLDGAGDDANDIVRDVIVDIASGARTAYVDLPSWTKVFEDGKTGKTDQENTVYILSVLNDALFRGATILGANIETSILKLWFERKSSLTFQPHEPITSQLLPPKQFGDRLEICFFFEHSSVSKNLVNKLGASGMPRIEEMDQLALEEFGNAHFLYVQNKPDRTRYNSVLADHNEAVEMPVMCHGLNEYAKYDNLYASASLNRKPKQFAMLNDIGLPFATVQKATAHETYYQISMRTSLRDASSDRPVKLIVPDRFVAEHLAGLLGTTRLRKIGNINEAPRLPKLTVSQKRQRLDSKKRWETIFTSPDTSCRRDEKTDAGDALTLTFHKSKYDRESEQFVMHEFMTTQQFIAFMRSEQRKAVEEKEDRYMFTPAVFNPPVDAPGYRRQEYFKNSPFLALDFDSGMSPHEFIAIFGIPERQEQRRSFIIFNSFSCQPDDPNRFRVIMFYTRAANSLKEHQAVFDWVVESLDVFGFSQEKSGLDRACRSGNQSFYMPCTNRLYPESAFFNYYWTKGAELQKYAIDPDFCFALCPQGKTETKEPDSISPSLIASNQCERLLDELQGMSDGRNAASIKVVCRLAKAGYSDSDIEREWNARFATDRKMMRRLSELMKSLRRYRLQW